MKNGDVKGVEFPMVAVRTVTVGRGARSRINRSDCRGRKIPEYDEGSIRQTMGGEGWVSLGNLNRMGAMIDYESRDALR